MKQPFSLLLAIVLSCLVVQQYAEADPLYRLASTTKPWRQPTQTSATSSRPIPQSYGDLSSHFIDLEDVMQDKRARQWVVSLKSRKIGSISWTNRIIWLTVGCFFAQMSRPQFTQWGLKVSEKILRGEQLYRLLSPVFLHGGLAHIATNMLSLSRVGQDMEKLFGSGRFVTTYLLSGIAGNLCSAYMSPNPGLGASGAVFGVIGAYYVFLSRSEWLLGDGKTSDL